MFSTHPNVHVHGQLGLTEDAKPQHPTDSNWIKKRVNTKSHFYLISNLPVLLTHPLIIIIINLPLIV
jgi:hypothetical protein